MPENNNVVEIKNLTLEGTVSTTNSGDDDGSGALIGRTREIIKITENRILFTFIIISVSLRGA